MRQLKNLTKEITTGVVIALVLFAVCAFGASVALENVALNSSKIATVTLYGGSIYNVQGHWENARNVVLGDHSVTFEVKGRTIVAYGNVIVEYK